MDLPLLVSIRNLDIIYSIPIVLNNSKDLTIILHYRLDNM